MFACGHELKSRMYTFLCRLQNLELTINFMKIFILIFIKVRQILKFIPN